MAHDRFIMNAEILTYKVFDAESDVDSVALARLLFVVDVQRSDVRSETNYLHIYCQYKNMFLSS